VAKCWRGCFLFRILKRQNL